MNFSAWCRGPRCDWDAWAETVGDEWWRWDNVVEHMKGLEDFHPRCPDGIEKYVRPVEGMHHQCGPIGIGAGAAWQSLVEHCIKGGMEAGQPLNTDHNDGNPIGIAVAQMNVDNGVRRNGATAFLGSNSKIKRDNLIITTNVVCKRVVFEGKRAVGAELIPAKLGQSNSERSTVVKARREIILSAGAF